MSSTILYKFRSGTTFEALLLPGSNARLLDIKKGIVAAKKLDQGSMDFDLSVKDATSGIEYTDDSAILPRGTRLVVQRLPSARGQGILAKIARSQFGEAAPTLDQSNTGPSADFYTIESRDRDDDDEFVSSSVLPSQQQSIEESELAALRAATDSTLSGAGQGVIRTGGTVLHGGPTAGGGGFRQNQPAGMGPSQNRGLTNFHTTRQSNKPNADPEIREQEQQLQKKRATGIPRTFLSLSAPTTTDGSDAGTVGLPQLQPNTIGFEELLNRGGGQSENTAGTKRDLDYAIKLTATTIPEYLQCAICHNVVRDAMVLPWDPEGRTTCEQCIRTALTENAFRCPLTMQEGVSPDDLVPNRGLRKAALQFINDVMEKMKEIEQQSEMEDEIHAEGNENNLLEGDLNDKGVVLTRRVAAAEKRKKNDNDPFGGDDDFGGDVFAVEAEKPTISNIEDDIVTENETTKQMNSENMEVENAPSANESDIHQDLVTKRVENKSEETQVTLLQPSDSKIVESILPPIHNNDTQNPSRRDANRRRGPPIGYTMGPAVVITEVEKPTETEGEPLNVDRPSRGGRGRSQYGSGRGYRGRHDSNHTGRDTSSHNNNSRSDYKPVKNEESRGEKRSRSASDVGNDEISDAGEKEDRSNGRFDGDGRKEYKGRGNYRREDIRDGRRGGRGGRDRGFEGRAGRWEGYGDEGYYHQGEDIGYYRGGGGGDAGYYRGGGRDSYRSAGRDGYRGGSREGFRGRGRDTYRGGGRENYRGGGRGRR